MPTVTPSRQASSRCGGNRESGGKCIPCTGRGPGNSLRRSGEVTARTIPRKSPVRTERQRARREPLGQRVDNVIRLHSAGQDSTFGMIREDPRHAIEVGEKGRVSMRFDQARWRRIHRDRRTRCADQLDRMQRRRPLIGREERVS